MGWWNDRKMASAIRKDNSTEVEKLVTNGADPNVMVNGKSLLMWTVEKGHLQLTQVLLDKGAEVNDEDRVGRTALITAAEKGHTEIAQALLDRDAKVDRVVDGKTALIWAAHNGHTKIAQALVDKAADMNVKDGDGWSALKWATNKGHMEIAQLLSAKGAVE
jgi:ankyrin repeat protein